MNPRWLEHKYTLTDDLNYLLVAVVVGVIFISLSLANGVPLAGLLFALLIIVPLAGYYIWRALAFDRHFLQHQAVLAELATAEGWELQADGQDYLLPPELRGSSLLLVADRDVKLLNYLKTPRWNYIDLSYSIYTQTKNGEYKSQIVYYSVLVTKLPRVLPNVFFDSKTEDGRKYKSKFVADQLHGLEGDFDEYFDTYFAEDYTIDSMSFVTPDVMLALEDACDYDIEITGDRLLLYGPVYLDAASIQDGADKLLAILKTLQVTGKAYRDNRLPGAAAAQTVTPLGMQLKRKRASQWASLAVLIGYGLFVIIRMIIAHRYHH